MRKDLIISGVRFLSEFEFKNGKKALKFIDDETGKILKVVVAVNSLSDYGSDFKVLNVRFYKDGFDVLEVSGDIIENV